MSDFADLMQKLVNEDYDTLLQMAKASLVEAVDIMSNATNEDDAIMYVMTFLSFSLAADGKFSATEQRFVNDLVGPLIDFYSVMECIDEKTYSVLNGIVDSLPTSDKSKLCYLAACVAAVDKTIDVNELHYLIDLMD